MPATIVGARSGCQADDRAAAGFGHVGQAGEQQFDGGEQQRVAVHAGGVVGVELLVDRGGGGGRAGDGDAAPDGSAHLGRETVEECRAGVGRRGSAAPRGRAGRSGCGALTCARRRRAARRESRRCGHGRRRTPWSRRRCRSRRWARSAPGRPDMAPRKVSCASSEPVSTRASRSKSSRTRAAKDGAVGGVAHGGGEHREVRLDSRASRSRRDSRRAWRARARWPPRRASPRNRRRRPRRVTSRAPEQFLDGAGRRIDVGDEQAGGVGSDVEDGDAHGARGC